MAAKTAFASFPLGSWHTLRIEVRGSQIQMLVDAHVALTGADTGWTYGGWGAVYYSGPQIAVRSFKIE